MAKNTNISYSNLMNQINALSKQAESVRQKETSTVLASIKQQMKEHGLSVKDLTGAIGITSTVKPKVTKKAAKPVSRGKAANAQPSKAANAKPTKEVSVAKKADKAPAKKAESKPTAQENTVSNVTTMGTPRKNKFSPRRKPEPKYMNPQTGQTWSGRGKTPTWLQGRRKSRFVIAQNSAVAS